MEVEARSEHDPEGPAAEIRRFAAAFLYLWVCLAAILLYKASVLDGGSVRFGDYALAALKALILAKFALAIHTLRIGDSLGAMPMIYVIVYRSIVFLVVVVAATFAEIVVVSLGHGRTMAETVAAAAGETWMAVAAAAPLLWLVTVPYFALRELGEALGPCALRRMLLGSAY